MNRINVLYFGSLRENLGKDSEIVQFTEPKTIKEVRESLIRNSTRWQSLDDKITVLSALNQEIVDEGAVVKDGDELAFIPPVTGG